MDLFTAMRISASGLSVQRTRMNATASNLANAETTRTAEGGPYRRRQVVVAAVPLNEVFDDVLGDALHGQTHSAHVVDIVSDPNDGRLVHSPDHPDANADGYVLMPNINAVHEMVNMVTATRSYEGNVTALQALKAMARQALQIGE